MGSYLYDRLVLEGMVVNSYEDFIQRVMNVDPEQMKRMVESANKACEDLVMHGEATTESGIQIKLLEDGTIVISVP